MAGFFMGGDCWSTALTRPESFVYLLIYPVLYPKYLKLTLFPRPFFVGRVSSFSLGLLWFPVAEHFSHESRGQDLCSALADWKWARFKSLVWGLLGPKYIAIILAFISGTLLAVLVWKRKTTKPYSALLLFLTISSATYLLLPSDWIEEDCFAVPVLPFFAILVTAIVSEVLGSLFPNKDCPWSNFYLAGHGVCFSLQSSVFAANGKILRAADGQFLWGQGRFLPFCAVCQCSRFSASFCFAT